MNLGNSIFKAYQGVDHGRFKDLLQGKKFTEERLSYFNEVLEYRKSSAMELAEQSLDSEEEQGDSESARKDTKLARYKEVHARILDAGLFDRPQSNQGFHYSKPKKYLAMALTENSSNLDNIYNQIERLIKLKTGALRLLTQTSIAKAIMQDKEVVRHRDKFYQSMGKIRNRLRSLSPTKRSRNSLT
ncbi:hypothetical protein FQN54_002620 [Arachnomyces sp. PD_36]|nr:hypothetical protein FQN54_002620 [Arachnomyces sp. PD_36]